MPVCSLGGLQRTCGPVHLGEREDGEGDLLFQIAKEQMIGNIDRVEEEPLFSVLAIMWSNYKEAKRYEEATKARKGH